MECHVTLVFLWLHLDFWALMSGVRRRLVVSRAKMLLTDLSQQALENPLAFEEGRKFEDLRAVFQWKVLNLNLRKKKLRKF